MVQKGALILGFRWNVTNLANSNMYSVAREAALRSFTRFVEPVAESPSANAGNGVAYLFCVLSSTPLSDQAKQALRNSAQSLGYAEGCFFAVTHALDGSGEMSPKELFDLIEGVDPLVLVAADAQAMSALSLAYRLPSGPRDIQPDRFQRVLGRNTVAFRSFEDLLATPQKKQQAWALLKQLPKLG